jgi:hypothetical protein
LIRLKGKTKHCTVLALYGEKIIISRTVTQSSSTYKLKDQQGRVVVEKKAKEELGRILACFNIQVTQYRYTTNTS